MKRSRLLATLVLASSSILARAETPETPDPELDHEWNTWSLGVVQEDSPEAPSMLGARFGRVSLFCGDILPCTGGSLAAENVGHGEDRAFRIVAGILGFYVPVKERLRFWIRPIAGLEYRTSDPDRGLGGVLGVGQEMIGGLSQNCFLAVRLDRVFFSAGSRWQAELAFRWLPKENSRTPAVAVETEPTAPRK